MIVYDAGLVAQPDGSLNRCQMWENVTPNTRKAAEKLLALRLQQLHSSDFIEPSTMPFDKFTIKWVDKYARDQVKPGTLVDYDGYFRTHLLRLLRQMLWHAVEWDYLRENPAAKVKGPIVTKKEMNYLRPAEVQEFLAAVPTRQPVANGPVI